MMDWHMPRQIASFINLYQSFLEKGLEISDISIISERTNTNYSSPIQDLKCRDII